MPVTLSNAPPAQACAANRQQNAPPADSASEDNARDFRSFMRAFAKTNDDARENAPGGAEEPAARATAKTTEKEPFDELAASVTQLIQGAEAFRRQLASERTEAKETERKGVTGACRDVCAASRFDPDIILNGTSAEESIDIKQNNAPIEASLTGERESPAEGAPLSAQASETSEGETDELTGADAGARSAQKNNNEGAKTAAAAFAPEGRVVESSADDHATREASPEEIAIADAQAFSARSREDGKANEDMADKTPGSAKASPAVGKAAQKTAHAPEAKHTETERVSSRADAVGDPGSMLRAGAGEDASETPAAPRTPGEPGASYPLDRNDAFGDGVTTMLRFLRDEGIAEARIVVEPPSLGRIDVSLQATASGVEAVFKVDNEHLRQVLQQQLDSLKVSLEAQGIHVSGLTVDIKNRDDGRHRDVPGTGRKLRRLGAAGEDGDEDGGAVLVRLDLERGMLHWVA